MWGRKRLIDVKQRIFKASEYWYLGMLVLLTVYKVLSYACLDIVWDNLGEGIPIIRFLIVHFLLEPNGVLLTLAVIRHICYEKYDIRELIAAVLICYLTAYAVKVNHHEEILMMILLMLCARGISFRRLLKIYFITVCLTVTGVVLASQFGLIENMQYQLSGRRSQMAFGFSYPTRFASHIFFLLLWYWYLRGNRMKYKEAIMPIMAGVFVWIFSNARLNTVCLFAMAGVMFWQSYSFRKAENRGTDTPALAGLAELLPLSPIIAALTITMLTVIYTSDNPFMYHLNQILNGRLSLTQKAIDIYGVYIWGRWIRMAGNGGYRMGNTKYFYIDSAFMQCSVRYGLVLLVMILLLFWFIGIRGKKYKNMLLMWALLFVSVHAMIEPQLMELQYCPLLFAAFAEFGEDGTERIDHEKA